MTLDWSALSRNQYPACGDDIADRWNPVTKMFECECGFRITETKMREVISRVQSRKLKNEIDMEIERSRWE